MWSWLNWFYQMFIRALWTVHPLPHSLRAPALSTPLPSVCTFILQECSSNRQYHGKSPGVGVGSVAMWCVSTVQADAQYTVLKSSLYFSLCLFGFWIQYRVFLHCHLLHCSLFWVLIFHLVSSLLITLTPPMTVFDLSFDCQQSIFLAVFFSLSCHRLVPPHHRVCLKQTSLMCLS